MKEFVISEAKVETAVLVGLITQTQDERKTNEYLDELAFLAETAGAEVVKRFTQKLPTANSVTYVGKGKLEEIRQYIHDEEEAEREVGMVIFDDELSAKQIRNIEAELKVKILDRTSLILDIFAMRAQTANAKTQVELAQYKYMLPRLQRLWTHLERHVRIRVWIFSSVASNSLPPMTGLRVLTTLVYISVMGITLYSMPRFSASFLASSTEWSEENCEGCISDYKPVF